MALEIGWQYIHTTYVAQLGTFPKSGTISHYYIAASSVIIAVLAAIASFQSATSSSLVLIEKNNSVLFQNQANKEWNYYLANKILKESREDFQQKAQGLEEESKQASSSSEGYFKKASRLANAGTIFQAAIALSSISLLLERKLLWQLSLVISAAGAYLLVTGLLL